MTPAVHVLPGRSTSSSAPEATVEEMPRVCFVYHSTEPWSLLERLIRHFRRREAITFADVLVRSLGAVGSADLHTFRLGIADTPPALDDYSEALFKAVRGGHPLGRSERLRALAREAAAVNRMPDDVEAWARQIARDVAGAAD